ncbi:hypothetical protein HOI83_04430 [Candidatus Uhrbacteria bacterium]|jgi:hypothetical protein|nr:hypothetical protein [Candidatus Uhrbacteria bacterium]
MIDFSAPIRYPHIDLPWWQLIHISDFGETMAQADLVVEEEEEVAESPPILELLQVHRGRGDITGLTARIEAAKVYFGASFNFVVTPDYVMFKFYGTCYTVAWFQGRLRIKPLMTGGPAGGDGKWSGSSGIAFLLKILSGHDKIAGVRMSALQVPVDRMCRQYLGAESADMVENIDHQTDNVREIELLLEGKRMRVSRMEVTPFRSPAIALPANLRGMDYQLEGDSGVYHVRWEGDELTVWASDGHAFGPGFLEAIGTL